MFNAKISLCLNLLLAVAAALAVSSCKCAGIDCGPNGSCDRRSGICICASGYEGTYCNTAWSAKFLSASGWGASDYVTASTVGTPLGDFSYVPIITVSSNTQLTVSNISGFSDSIVTLVLTSPTTLNLSANDGVGRVYAGTGTAAGDGSAITWNYTVTYSDGTSDTITGTWTKN